MKGEFDSAQRETTDAYRQNWLRIWGMAQLSGMAKLQARHYASGQTYPNGCPILDEDQRGESVQR